MIFRTFFVSWTVGVLLSAVGAQADFNAGQQAWDAGHPVEALDQWTAAAGAGDARAMLALGHLYLQGLGAPQDFVEAHKWFNLAASRGNAEAAEERDALAARMTPAQIADAQRLAGSWRAGGPASPVEEPSVVEDAGSPPARALREAQTLLRELGYAPGPADGVWGRRSMEAYRAFLQDTGQPAGDTLTPESLQALRDVAARRDAAPAMPAAATVSPPDLSAEPSAEPPVRLPDGLTRAAQAGDLNGLEAALEAGANPDARDGRGWTALMHAANKGYTVVVDRLLDAGAAPDVRAPDGATALFIAALLGHSEVIEVLMEAGADTGLPGPKGKSVADVLTARYGNYETAKDNGENPAVLALLREGETAEAEEPPRGRAPGDTFRDCPECPEMVVLPAGSFMMGSPASERGHNEDESPLHQVTIPVPFAIGKHEVTFAEWNACVMAGGCGGHIPDDEGWGRSNRPVINVSWDDARAYIRWLSQHTGKHYWLPSEAEWEYAARAGSQTRYAWGDDIGHNRANCADCGSRWDDTSTAPVGSFAPNSFGLHDMHGNVWEWTDDCWNGTYKNAPTDGTAWRRGDCDPRMVRSGSWSIDAKYVRSALRGRGWGATERRGDDLGFRVARALAP